MGLSRIASIVIGILVSLSLFNLTNVNWYVASGLGILCYFISRYIFWAVQERRSFKREIEEVVEKAKKNEP